MLTDWRALYLAVHIFFHISHRHFKWNHVLSEREEGRQHRVVKETLLASDNTWGWTCMWNDFSLRSYREGLTKPLLTVCKLVGKVFKTRRLTWAKGPPCQIKNTTKQLKVGGIRVWGFLLTRGLETPLTLREAKMPGCYGGINKAPRVANTVSRTCLKESCFSSPLLIRLLSCLPQPAARSQITHRASDQRPGCWSVRTDRVCTYWGHPAGQNSSLAGVS